MNRTQALRRLVDSGGFGLEIGPSHSPIFPRSEGFNVETLDHASADELRTKYSSIGIDTSRIEDVTYVSDGAALHETVPRRGEYDFIFSSHTIEHVSDLVGYFQSCDLLLKPNGIIAMAIPDKRYTFDILQPVSTTGRALEAHWRGTGRHTPAAVYDFFANTAFLGKRDTWTQVDTGELSFTSTPEVAHHAFGSSVLPGSPYMDVHGWFFTPNSFRLIMQDLRRIGLSPFDEIYMQDCGALEFHVALARDRPDHGLDRMTLQRNLLREQIVSGLQALALDDDAMSALFTLALKVR